MTPHETLLYWIRERYKILLDRAWNRPKPWTKDPILQAYRFCNVHREEDTVTRWINRNWRTPFAWDPDLWFAMCVARLVNWPDTLQAIGYPVPWKPGHFVAMMHGRRAAGEKVFSGAYIVSTNGHAMDKAEYLVQHVLTPLWNARVHLRPADGDTLREAFNRLQEFNGLGSFMAAQVIADLKYVSPLLESPDWHTFAASGPGSRRGLNRLVGRSVDTSWKSGQWESVLAIEHAKILKALGPTFPTLHAQDFQNCLCEFDKYMRVKLGEGKPRSGYPGK